MHKNQRIEYGGKASESTMRHGDLRIRGLEEERRGIRTHLGAFSERWRTPPDEPCDQALKGCVRIPKLSLIRLQIMAVMYSSKYWVSSSEFTSASISARVKPVIADAFNSSATNISGILSL